MEYASVETRTKHSPWASNSFSAVNDCTRASASSTTAGGVYNVVGTLALEYHHTFDEVIREQVSYLNLCAVMQIRRQAFYCYHVVAFPARRVRPVSSRQRIEYVSRTIITWFPAAARSKADEAHLPSGWIGTKGCHCRVGNVADSVVIDQNSIAIFGVHHCLVTYQMPCV